MSAEKLSPRQQMIGIMYLVLLAMLAMNASKDLLDAFLKLETGIDLTASNFSNNVLPVYNKISSAAATNSVAAKEAHQKAILIKKETQEVFDLINNHKKWLIENTDGLDDKGVLKAKDNQDIAAEYFLVKENGKVLKEKIMHLKSLMTGSIDKKDQAIIKSINELLATNEYVDYEENKMSWEAGISEHLPLAAVTANLSNLQSYLRNAESISINYLYENIGINDYKVNKIQAAILTDNSYVMRGEEFQAKIFLAASDTTQEPMILVGEYDEELFAKNGQIKWLSKVDTLDIKDGFGQYRKTESAVGEHAWKGLVRIPHPNPHKKGEYLTYPFENKFLVAQPSAVVSSEKLNIMYLKIPNEINISVPGIASEKLRVTAENCTVSKISNGKFNITPNKAGSTKITVQAEIAPGKWETMGTYPWKAKQLPKPDIWLGNGIIKGKISKTDLIGNGKIDARYSPDFPMNANPKIKTCRIEIWHNANIFFEKVINNGVFTQDVQDKIRLAPKGSTVYLIGTTIGEDLQTYPFEIPVILK